MNHGQDLSERALLQEMRGLKAIDPSGVHARSTMLATRSVKGQFKAHLVDLAISMVDLTTLEGSDTPSKVANLSHKALRPDHEDPSCPTVAAVCVYGDLVKHARDVVGTGCHVAAVATAFPSGRASIKIKLLDTTQALEHGADEIDMVIDRGAFLSGNYEAVYQEIQQVKSVCAGAHLKVILETGELGSLENIRKASWLAMLAGADTVKTSTGKAAVSATPASVLVMLQTVRDYYEQSGVRVGVKAAGGVKSTKEALGYLVMARETVGDDWLTPDLFRFGASVLLNDLVMQRRKVKTGQYPAPHHVSID